MAEKHPYMSGSAGLVQVVAQLRKTFPSKISADTLKKLGIAPNNETYVINTLRFVNIIDSEGNKNAKAAPVFNQHEDVEFQNGLSELVKNAYSDLFSLHGDASWTLPTDKLISFFRNSDHTSAIVGKRQAMAFQGLSSLCGKLEGTIQRPASKTKVAEKKSPKTLVKQSASPPKKAPAHAIASPVSAIASPSDSGVALTVRIEINLPASGDQETYDRIFKSIRENLLNVQNT